MKAVKKKEKTVFVLRELYSTYGNVFTTKQKMYAYLKKEYSHNTSSVKINEVPGSEGKILEVSYFYTQVKKGKLVKENLKQHYLVSEMNLDPKY